LGLQRSVKKHALKIHQDITKDILLSREKHEGIIGVSIYVACQQRYIPRGVGEISEGTGVNKREITELFRFLMKKLKLQKVAIDSKKWVQHFCVRLNLYDDISDTANEILFRYDEKRRIIQKINPKGYVAGAVYIAAILNGEHRTQKEVAEVAGVSEVTIGKYYKELAENVEMEVLL